MIVSYLVDPEAFNPDYFDTTCKLQAKLLLKGILKNGVLVTDCEQRLLSSLLENVQKLPEDSRQPIEILLEEIGKSGGPLLTRLLPCPSKLCNVAGETDLSHIAEAIKKVLRVNCLILSELQHAEKMEENRGLDATFISIDRYDESRTEQKRARWAEGSLVLKKVPQQTIADALDHLLRHAREISFYDAFMGACTDRNKWAADRKADKWFHGLDYILSVVRERNVFVKERLKIRLVTREIWVDPEKKLPETDAKKWEQADAIKRFREQILKPLQTRYRGWDVAGVVKRDPYSRVFRHRLLQTEYAVVDFNEGFDLFEPPQAGLAQRQFRSNYARIDNTLSGITADIRKLDDVA